MGRRLELGEEPPAWCENLIQVPVLDEDQGYSVARHVRVRHRVIKPAFYIYRKTPSYRKDIESALRQAALNLALAQLEVHE